MVTFEVNAYLLENAVLDKVILIDKDGKHAPVEFIPANTTQVVINIDGKDLAKSLTDEQLQKIADGMKES